MFVIADDMRPIKHLDTNQVHLYSDRISALKALCEVIEQFPLADIVEVTLEKKR